MEIAEMLDEIKKKAQEDADLKEELLRTREQKNPLSAFCSKCRELGYSIYEMDVIAAGEESYAAMKRSTRESHAFRIALARDGVAHSWDIESGGLYQKVTHGKYMWDPDEEEFPLFLRSIYHAARDLLDAAEAECNVTGNTDALRISSQERLFHCLAMQFVEPADCLPKIAEPDMVDKENRKIYRFRAYVGEKQNLDIMRRIASLRAAESVYPAALRNGRLMIADKNGGSLGHLSFAEDELYYCLFPFMSAHMAQVQLTVKKVQRNKGNYLRHAKAEIEFLIRLNQEADNYRNPDMNERIERILSDYRNQLRGAVYAGIL
ncbi:MAG: hypothetical protein LUG99_03905 [Lachnospiraceae bacterium]|nr:hypothetical protein [Lachnospiraceae bacterium]